MTQYSTESDIANAVNELTATFATGKTRALPFRLQQLRSLRQMLVDHEARLLNALYLDLHKSRTEGDITELTMVIGEIDLFIDNLAKWSAPERPTVGLLNKMNGCEIRWEPKGIVLVIGAWNYPINLALVPLVNAIGAGNTVILKPSEVSWNTAQLLMKLMPQYLDSCAYRVINGAVTETTKLLEYKFDHILYTGSGNVGRIIVNAANKYLTPVTLELGGKSPVFVDSNVDMEITANRIAWGKFMNAGQTCIAPDYVIMPSKIREEFVSAFTKAVERFYPQSDSVDSEYPRIVSERQWDRIMNLLRNTRGKVVLGGTGNREDRYIAPSLVLDVDWNDSLMSEELFGPVLPVITAENVDEAIYNVGQSKDKNYVETVLNKTRSGAAVVNDTMMHAGGPSGHGSYHGKYGFQCFSHQRSTMWMPQAMENVNALRYPPYNSRKRYWLRLLLSGHVDRVVSRCVLYSALAGALAVLATAITFLC